jgi:hypothetical protein
VDIDAAAVAQVVREEMARSKAVADLWTLQPRALAIPAGSTVFDLGPIVGQGLTAVRLTAQLLTAGTGGNTYIRLRPNGLNPVQTDSIDNYVNWNTAVAAAPATRLASNFAATPGLVIAPTDWGTASNEVYVEGTFWTNLPAGFQLRQWVGRYKNHDRVSNQQQMAMGTLSSVWSDAASLLTSLQLVIDAGSFSGRVVLEFLP